MTDARRAIAEDRANTLERRAAQLAHRPSAPDAGPQIEVLVCRLGTERYAIETRSLRAVQLADTVTPVPCVPSYVLGIVSVRGEIVTLLDLASLIGLVPSAAAETHRPIVLLDVADLRAGLVVDEIIGVERLALDALQPAPSGRDFIRGVAQPATVLLDLDRLFAGGRFDVLDDVL